jgi:hypothetical protein
MFTFSSESDMVAFAMTLLVGILCTFMMHRMYVVDYGRKLNALSHTSDVRASSMEIDTDIAKTSQRLKQLQLLRSGREIVSEMNASKARPKRTSGAKQGKVNAVQDPEQFSRAPEHRAVGRENPTTPLPPDFDTESETVDLEQYFTILAAPTKDVADCEKLDACMDMLSIFRWCKAQRRGIGPMDRQGMLTAFARSVLDNNGLEALNAASDCKAYPSELRGAAFELMGEVAQFVYAGAG